MLEKTALLKVGNQMPRESRAIPKMIGLENEYGCLAKFKGNDIVEDAGTNFVLLYKPEWLEIRSSGSWDPTERLEGLANMHDSEDARRHVYFKDQNWRYFLNFIMPNGARFYCDMNHPEICIPLSRNAREALLYDRACEWLMNFIRKKHYEVNGDSYMLIKNNTASGFENGLGVTRAGVSFATHENYLVSRGVPIKTLVAKVLPFLVMRTVLIGAGKVGSHGHLPYADFQLSQRADFFRQATGSDTTGWLRPIYNLRDHPYADPRRFRRLHVIPGDANMCEMAEFIKFVTMQVLLMMIEDNYLDSRFTLDNPVESFYQVSRDLDFREKTTFKGKRRSRTALDALKEYTELMWNYLEIFNIQDEMLRFGVKETGKILEMLASSPYACFGILDHVTKKMIIENKLEKGEITSWQDPNAKTLDMKYHNINREESLFYHPKIYPKMKRLLTDEEVQRASFEGPPTRSRFQVEVHKRFGLQSWNWREFYINDENGRPSPIIFLEDPAISWEKLEPLLANDRKEFLKRVKDAGLMESSPKNDRRDEGFELPPIKKASVQAPSSRGYLEYDQDTGDFKHDTGPVRESDDTVWQPDFSDKKLDELKKKMGD